ncbi:MAG TPA: FAD-containing monooxygenase EthA, partial [Nannocystis sp.]
GYINASWTLRADLVAEHVCRLLNHMAKIRARQVTPRRPSDVGTAPILSLTSGYIQRAIDRVPRQGTRDPWRVRQNYILELLRFRLGRVADPALEFT